MSLYHFIPTIEKKFLEGMIKSKLHRKGDFLLMDGDIQTDLYVIKSGVATLRFDQPEKVKFFDFAYHNRFCVDIGSFSDQSPSIYCIECLEDCVVERIGFQDLQKAFDASSAIERAYRILLEKIHASLIQKCLILETKSIKERFEWVMNTKPELFRLVPHKYIASFINVEATNFSKLYNQFCVRNGLLYE